MTYAPHPLFFCFLMISEPIFQYSDNNSALTLSAALYLACSIKAMISFRHFSYPLGSGMMSYVFMIFAILYICLVATIQLMLCCCAYLNHEHPIGMKNMLFLEVHLVSSKHKNKTTHGLYTTFKKLVQFIPPRIISHFSFVLAYMIKAFCVSKVKV